ncbi:hypothetical protein PAHAL_1G186900 [Panicum hallii]|jgi:hypothetical protein|uniref:Uncharacterized protein n=1 Tax=Panicum hallii TaxID=206008 RepID=A0A2T8IGA6_9POAL|nr:hypothetical protein PAHAL_6G146700 [Panicum hallii]PVH66255.1 hypothetical protein PAHAL_1G186900 [Panicum hallii]
MAINSTVALSSPSAVYFPFFSSLSCSSQAEQTTQLFFSFSLPDSDFLFTEQSKSEQGIQPQAPRHPNTSTCSFFPPLFC